MQHRQVVEVPLLDDRIGEKVTRLATTDMDRNDPLARMERAARAAPLLARPRWVYRVPKACRA
jgi:hypothetical protein